MHFLLPFSPETCRLVLDTPSELIHKDFVLKLQFLASELSSEDAKDLRLFWSTAFDSFYLYSPDKSAADAIVRTRSFFVPEGTSEVVVEPLRWSRKNIRIIEPEVRLECTSTKNQLITTIFGSNK